MINLLPLVVADFIKIEMTIFLRFFQTPSNRSQFNQYSETPI